MSRGTRAPAVPALGLEGALARFDPELHDDAVVLVRSDLPTVALFAERLNGTPHLEPALVWASSIVMCGQEGYFRRLQAY